MSENPGESVRPADSPIVEVTWAYRFSAAHRLHNPRFSPTENARIYGRCNNPSGHGHTYCMEVTIRGPVSAEIGGVDGGALLDEVVRSRVIQRFDRGNLDLLVDPAIGPTSTTEVLAGSIWRILDAALPAGMLSRLRLEETANNFFELDRHGESRVSDPAAARTAGRGQKASPA